MPIDMYFSGLNLDRAHHRRRDEKWIDDAQRGEKARVLPLWRDRNLITAGEVPTAAAVANAEKATLLDAATEIVFLGHANGETYFAADISHLDDPAEAPTPADSSFEDLRQIATRMDQNEAGILAYARGLMFWHRTHRFCGSCGSPTLSDQAGHVRVCSDASCERSHFPRTDPAVIMLVTRTGPDGEQCLLGHNKRFKGLRYSTLAGFVEPGETLEDAVAREVLEESGIKTKDITYQASQPWPFPASLMLGYRARAASDEINVDGDELVDAQWFSRDQVIEMGNKGEVLPPAGLSISRWLIDRWLAEGDSGEA